MKDPWASYPGSLIATKTGLSDCEVGPYPGDKSVRPWRLVKGGPAEPARRRPGPVGPRLPSRSPHRMVHRLEELGRRGVSLGYVRTQGPVQHLLQGLTDVIPLSAGSGK